MIARSLFPNDETSCNVPLLGHLLWFSVSGCQVTHEDMAEALKKGGLPLRFLPPKIQPRDAFRRATILAQTKRLPLPGNKFLNLLVREVKSDRDVAIRHMVEEVVDAKNVRLTYTPSVEFRLEGEDFCYTYLHYASDGDIWHEVVRTTRGVKERYEDALCRYDSRAVRAMVMNVLNSCSPVSVRPSGGVYFTPIRHGKTINGLRTFLSALSGAGILYTVPVLDEKEHREMVQNSLETAVSEEADRILSEIRNLSASSVSARTAAKLLERAKSLGAMAEEYAGIVATRVLAAQCRIEEAMSAAVGLAAESVA